MKPRKRKELPREHSRRSDFVVEGRTSVLSLHLHVYFERDRLIVQGSERQPGLVGILEADRYAADRRARTCRGRDLYIVAHGDVAVGGGDVAVRGCRPRSAESHAGSPNLNLAGVDMRSL